MARDDRGIWLNARTELVFAWVTAISLLFTAIGFFVVGLCTAPAR